MNRQITPESTPPRERVFESVTRRTYWIGTGVLTLVLAGLSWWGGLYITRTPEEHLDQRLTSNDPISQILYSPLGTVVVLLTFQFFAANLLFWLGAWVRLRLRRS